MMGPLIMLQSFIIFSMKKYIVLFFLVASSNSYGQVVPQGYLINSIGMIGSQVWATSNLSVTTFNNGNAIPNYTSSTGWGTLTTPAMCSYNFDPANDAIYGKLYNWYAVNDSRGICPVDWHVPTNAEFTQLNSFIGGNGGKLKQKGIKTIDAGALWITPNAGAVDTYSFTALPAGYMGTTTPSNLGNLTFFWTNTSYDATHAYTWSLSKDNTSFSNAFSNTKVGGFSVRCIHD